MKSIERSVTVKVPLDVAYATWADYRHFPAFTGHVIKAERISLKRSKWIVEFLGYKLEFEAEIDELKPNKLISWHSISSVKHFGSVHFESSDSGTIVTARILFDTETLSDDLVEDLDISWDEFESVFEETLESFKNYVEHMWWQMPAVI